MQAEMSDQRPWGGREVWSGVESRVRGGGWDSPVGMSGCGDTGTL